MAAAHQCLQPPLTYLLTEDAYRQAPHNNGCAMQPPNVGMPLIMEPAHAYATEVRCKPHFALRISS